MVATAPVVSIKDIIDTLGRLPAGTLIPIAELRAMLMQIPQDTTITQEQPAASEPQTWKEKVWIAAPETRLNIQELGEAISRSRSWIMTRLHPRLGSSLTPIPHRKLAGQIQFVVQEIRDWISQEEVIQHVKDHRIPLPSRSRQ